jgi:hypothetical protein
MVFYKNQQHSLIFYLIFLNYNFKIIKFFFIGCA